MLLLFLLLTTQSLRPTESTALDWIHPSPPFNDGGSSHCSTLRKAVFHGEHKTFPDQWVELRPAHNRIPDLKEFTLCTFHKFYNHSVAHPIFWYGAKDIISWISNTDQSSFYQLSITGHTIYRLNYPIRLHKWYHTCQSWNGNTGEWQLWINGERVGRGFHNLLVGRVIKGGGKAGAGGAAYGDMEGEITMIQLYKAALTAGKAYYDHKHHHAHKFHHEDKLGEDDPENGGMVGQNSILRNQPDGIQQQAQQEEGGDNFNSAVLANYLASPVLAQQQQNLGANSQPAMMIPVGSNIGGLLPGVPIFPQSLNSGTGGNIRLFKREPSEEKEKKDKRDLELKENEAPKAELEVDKPTKSEKKTKKRTTFNDAFQPSPEDFLVPGGLDLGSNFNFNIPPVSNINPLSDIALKNTDSAPKKYTEPAEWEVKAVSSVCSACGEDPFAKANVLSWQKSVKKVHGGAILLKANQECHNF